MHSVEIVQQHNLALGQPTYKSDGQQTLNGYSTISANAVDGNPDGILSNNSCTTVTYSYATTNPWWAVDLGQPTYVDNIFIISPSNCTSCSKHYVCDHEHQSIYVACLLLTQANFYTSKIFY